MSIGLKTWALDRASLSSARQVYDSSLLRKWWETKACRKSEIEGSLSFAAGLWKAQDHLANLPSLFEMRSCSGESKFLSVELNLMLSGYKPVTRTSARIKALSLTMVQSVQAGDSAVPTPRMGADYPHHWGQGTKRHLVATRPIGDTGEIPAWSYVLGSQRIHMTCLLLTQPRKRKALCEHKATGKGSKHLPYLCRFYSISSTNSAPWDPKMDVSDYVRNGADALVDLWISSFRRRDWIYHDLSNYLKGMDIWIIAYHKLRPNPGSMSPATDGLTIDGTSFCKLQALRDAVLDSESPYQWGGTNIIPKPGKRGRISLGIPHFQDRIVQEVLRMLLEPIYESVFYRKSHGWRPGRSAHTALRTIRSDFKGTNWMVPGNIKKLFDTTVNHGVLCHIMRRKIRDKKLLKLIGGGFKTKIHMPYENIEESNLVTPEGRILSRILSNIYLNEFDIWLEERIQQYNLGGRDNRSWVLFRNQGRIGKARSRSDPFDPLYRRMEYRRYGDYFLIAIRGPLSDAKAIRQECETFLREKLKLLLNMEKPHIKHISVGIPFLGYRIGRRVVHTKQRYQTREGWQWRLMQRVILTMDADMNQLKLQLQQQAYLAGNGDPLPNFGLMSLPQSEANRRMNSILRGYANWYQFAGNKRRAIAYLAYVLRSSLAKMFAAKLKLHSLKKVFQIAGNNLGRALEARYPVGVTDSQVKAWQQSVSGKGTPRDIPGIWKISQQNRIRSRLLRHTKKR
uniref:Reverse transcriptase domain-containing protein n=1 Tax=Treubia lacunosa TaxID=93845 RepID=G4Y9U4_9MARC|nr:hypothetical protein TrlaMp45 [Treubia lacunosa]AEH99740.1 hypothetical protein TrlaMp45 [Treubia lacunosa]